MKKIIELLNVIGISDDAGRVYLACLKLGSASVVELSKQVNIPRATVYLLLNELKMYNLISETVVGKRKRIVAENPQNLIDIARGQKQKLSATIDELEQNMTQIMSLYSSKVDKPKIKLYEGVEGVKQIYEDTLNYSEILVQCFTQDGIKLMGGYLDKYFKRLKRREIITREIVSDSPLDREYQRTMATSRNKIVCMPVKYGTNTDFMVYGDNVSMITYRGGQPVGVVISDPEIARFHRINFEVFWKAAKGGIL